MAKRKANPFLFFSDVNSKDKVEIELDFDSIGFYCELTREQVMKVIGQLVFSLTDVTIKANKKYDPNRTFHLVLSQIEGAVHAARETKIKTKLEKDGHHNGKENRSR